MSVYFEPIVKKYKFKPIRKSVCSYCGVGCNLEVDILNGNIKANKNSIINRGGLCLKGASLLESIDKKRLENIQIRGNINKNFSETSWDKALGIIADAIKFSGPKKVGFYSSGQVLVEDYYVANKLFKGFVGTSNIDSNSRTCIASSVVALQKAFGVDIVPAKMSDVLDTELIILIGANPAEAHVVFYQKYIKKAISEGKKLVVIDPRETESAKSANLYLPIKPGKDINFLNAVAAKLIEDRFINEDYCRDNLNNFDTFKEALCELDIEKEVLSSGIEYSDFEKFISLIKESKKMVSISCMGLNQSSQGVDKNLALFNLHFILNRIGQKGNGVLPETGQPNAMGGREVGALATMLAVHLDFSLENRQKVASFWKTDLNKIPKEKGLTIMEMIEAAERGELNILIIMHTDPVYSLPNRSRIENALKKIPIVVEINAYENTLTKEFAHIRLPAKPWGLKEGHHTNMDRHISYNRAIAKDNSKAKEDWKILCKIAEKLGYREYFDYKKPNEIYKEFLEMTKLSKEQHMNHFEMDLKKVNKSKENFRWGEEFFTKHKALTPNKKYNLSVVKNRQLSLYPTNEFPFILLTIRTRDQWNSISKTLEIEKLKKYKPLSFIEINPEDAKVIGIENNQKVKVTSWFGSVETVAFVTNSIKKGVVAMPISDRNINYLTSSIYDQESKEPDYNHTPVKVELI